MPLVSVDLSGKGAILNSGLRLLELFIVPVPPAPWII